MFTAIAAVEGRLKTFEAELDLDSVRALNWGWAQAVLAAIWLVEDGFPIEAGHPFLTVASTIRMILGHGVRRAFET